MRNSSSLSVGGISPLSTCDWPGELVATVFTQGCPWDCAYCHNPHLLPPEADGQTAWEDVLAFLDTRRGLLDGVVFSGGEPLAQPALAEAIAQVRARGFAIGLHTNGVSPERLDAVLPLVDWVGLDVKAPFSEYERITGVSGSGDRARESARRLVGSGVPYEVRTTVHPRLLDMAALERLAADLRSLGVARWVVQGYRPDGVRAGLAPARLIEADLSAGLREGFEEFSVRAG